MEGSEHLHMVEMLEIDPKIPIAKLSSNTHLGHIVKHTVETYNGNSLNKQLRNFAIKEQS